MAALANMVAKAIHGALVWPIQTTALTNSRLSFAATPPSPTFLGGKLLMRSR